MSTDTARGVEQWRRARELAEQSAFRAWRDRRNRWRKANGLSLMTDDEAASIYAAEQQAGVIRR